MNNEAKTKDERRFGSIITTIGREFLSIKVE
jgi:hypothetical protein